MSECASAGPPGFSIAFVPWESVHFGVVITKPMAVQTSLSSFNNQVPKAAPRATELSFGKSVWTAFVS